MPRRPSVPAPDLETTTAPDRLVVLKLAAASCCDPRTAATALREGTGGLRGLTRHRIEAAAREMGVALGKVAAG